jgi:hypothetical protein
MGDFFNSIGTGIEDAFSSASDSVGSLFDGSVDPSSEIKEGFMYGEDDDTSLFGDWATDEEGSLSGYTATLDPSTGEMEYFKDSKWDSKKASEALSKLGSTFDGSPQVIGKSGSLPGVNFPNAGVRGYRPTDSLYAPPSSQAYNERVAQLVKTLLGEKIRAPKISSLV